MLKRTHTRDPTPHRSHWSATIKQARKKYCPTNLLLSVCIKLLSLLSHLLRCSVCVCVCVCLRLCVIITTLSLLLLLFFFLTFAASLRCSIVWYCVFLLIYHSYLWWCFISYWHRAPNKSRSTIAVETRTLMLIRIQRTVLFSLCAPFCDFYFYMCVCVCVCEQSQCDGLR